LLVLFACRNAPDVAVAPEMARPAPESEEVEEHMGVHFERAKDARDALMFGDLDVMREPLTWLAHHQPPPDLPGTGLSQFDAMCAAATRGVEARDIESASRAVADVSRACGACHAAVGDGPTFDTSLLPPLEEGAKSHMARHRWAADRMWEALIQPSDSAWEGAIVMLGEGAMGEEVMSEAIRRSPKALELAKRVHALAEEDAPTPQLRAELYARLLATCAACHLETGTERPTHDP